MPVGFLWEQVEAVALPWARQEKKGSLPAGQEAAALAGWTAPKSIVRLITIIITSHESDDRFTRCGRMGNSDRGTNEPSV